MRVLYCRVALLLVACAPALALQAPAEQAKPVGSATRVASPKSAELPDIRELLRKASENDERNDKKLRNYTYIQRVEEHKLDGSGNTKSVETRTREIINLYGGPVGRLVAKDDKPLSEKEAAKEEERVNRIAAKRRDESPEDKEKRLAREEKARQQERAFDKEIADAFDFTLQGDELVNGRPAWIIHGEPRQGYQPKLKEARILPKLRGTVWIDKEEAQFVRGDIEFIDDLSFGLVVARIHKGSTAHFEFVRVNDEVWLPQTISARFSARVLLVKGFNEQIQVAYQDYKKFRTDSRVLGVVEEPPPPPPPRP